MTFPGLRPEQALKQDKIATNREQSDDRAAIRYETTKGGLD